MLNVLESIIWAIAVVFIVYSGIFYTFKLKFVQFRFGSMFKNLFSQTEGNISPFESLMMVLGGRIGVGSIAGISLAIYMGGIGTIFWIWVIGFISAPNAFAETVLGIKYQEKDNLSGYGGPSFYLKKGLSKSFLSKFYAFIIVFSYIGGFLSVQSNTIATSISSMIYINPILVGIIISIISFLIIIKGIKNIANISKYLVPIMTIIYVSAALFIVIMNFKVLPLIFLNIIKEAFNFKALGFGVLANMVIGIQRGIFSSEAGLGTGAIASSSVVTEYPAKCGFVQMIGVYITTFLICTSTAVVVLTTNVDVSVINGIELTQAAFINHFGNFGNLILNISIILFAFSTILSGYYDGESSLKFLFSKSKICVFVLKIIMIIVIICGSVIKATILWKIVNILTGVLAIINIYAIINLKKEVVYELKKYDKIK